MRVLLLADKLEIICGVSSHLYNLSLGFKKKGIDFKIACGGGSGIDKFRKAGAEVIEFPSLLHENRNPLNYLKAHIDLFAFLTSGKFDLLHSHHHYCANIASNLSRLLHLKTLQTNHGILPERGRLQHFAADRYIAVSDHIFDYMLNTKKIDSAKINLIYNGCRNPRLNKSKKLDKIRILAASRLVEEKGIQDLLYAVNLLDEKLLGKGEFFVAGEGVYEKELIKINMENGNRINFIGKIKNLSEKMCEYDLIVICSRREGFPMTMLEAAFANCMIISTDYEGLNRYFNRGNGCMIYRIGDAVMLAGILAEILEHPEVIKINGEKIRRIVTGKFDGDKMINSTISAYIDTLHEK